MASFETSSAGRHAVQRRKTAFASSKLQDVGLASVACIARCFAEHRTLEDSLEKCEGAFVGTLRSSGIAVACACFEFVAFPFCFASCHTGSWKDSYCGSGLAGSFPSFFQ